MTLVVWRLDRLGRSLRHLIDTVTSLAEQGIGFKSLQESIDKPLVVESLCFIFFGALAEFEREINRERTRAGLEAARSRGRKGGPKHKLTPKQVEIVRQLYKVKSHSLEEICDSFGISRVTLWRYVKAAENEAG